jgi:hypothetical protein
MRSRRDWVVDAGAFLLAAGYAVVTADARQRAGSLPVPAWLFDVDQVVGALGCVALWWRRRWPVGLAVTLVALSTFSELVAGAMVVALFTVAVHRPPRTTAAVFALSLLAAVVYVLLRPDPGEPRLPLLLLGVAIQGAAVGWGLFVRHRRQLVLSLRERAAAAETEARLRARRRAPEVIILTTFDADEHVLRALRAGAAGFVLKDTPPAEIVAAVRRVARGEPPPTTTGAAARRGSGWRC